MAAQFDQACWVRVENHLASGPLTHVPGSPGRSIWQTTNGHIVLGRRHVGNAAATEFFFNVESTQIATLTVAPHGWIAFACGLNVPTILLVPLGSLLPHVVHLSVTARIGFTQHNLRVLQHGGLFNLAVPGGLQVALTPFII